MKFIERWIKSTTAPTDTSVGWIDVSGDTPLNKIFNNGEWIPTGSTLTQEYVDEQDIKYLGAIEERDFEYNPNAGIADTIVFDQVVPTGTDAPMESNKEYIIYLYADNLSAALDEAKSVVLRDSDNNVINILTVFNQDVTATDVLSNLKAISNNTNTGTTSYSYKYRARGDYREVTQDSTYKTLYIDAINRISISGGSSTAINIYPSTTGLSDTDYNALIADDSNYIISHSVAQGSTGDVLSIYRLNTNAASTGAYRQYINVRYQNGYDYIDSINVSTASGHAVTKSSTSIKNSDVYGVMHYYNLSSPILTRIGNLDLHRTLPVQSQMRRCLLNDDGTVNYYLSATDSTKKEDGTTAAVLDGTDGQVMVEVPEHYRRHTLDTVNGTYAIEISLYPFTGAYKINKHYISAYEATFNDNSRSISTSKLSSIVNDTIRGGSNNSAYDGQANTLMGMPATSTSLTNFRTFAKNRNISPATGWNCYEYDAHISLYWLYVIEYANLNCQAEYNASLTTEGYHQGGLGAGVTNMSSTNWNNYNGYNPFIPCGYTNSLGNNTGVKAYTFDSAQEVLYGSAFTTNVPSYRGVENPFGHIWKWTDGFLAIGTGTAQAQEVYICNLRTAYASSKNDSYSLRATSSCSNGYFKTIINNEFGDLLAMTGGADASTYFCDYHYQANSSGTTYGLSLGGSANSGSYAGLGYFHSYYTPGDAYSNFGSRLCYCSQNYIMETA